MKRKKMQENIAQPISKYPSIYWERFFNRFNEIETLPTNEWKALHLIAYFCKHYNTYYHNDYSFKFNSNSPSKSYEVFQINKLGGILSTDPKIIKDYIDWWFATQIIKKKNQIRSMAFLTDTNIVNIYKFDILIPGNLSIDRTTALPKEYIDIISLYEPEIKTYGALAFANLVVKSGNGSKQYNDMFTALMGNGLDLTILDKIK
jgi:hypothetical protein